MEEGYSWIQGALPIHLRNFSVCGIYKKRVYFRHFLELRHPSVNDKASEPIAENPGRV